MREMAGKVAVVTGGGAGIGRATALSLSRAGMVVAACDLDGASAKETAEMVMAEGGRASAHQVDVASEAQMRALVDAVLAEHGVVDVVVNNAGIGIAPGPTVDVPLDRFHRVMDINFWGVVHGSLGFLPHLLARPAGNLVNVASNAGLIGYPRMAPYTSSKFAVRGFTETLRMELRSTKVRVTLVCPGATRTGLLGNSPVIDDGQRQAMQRAFDRSALRPPEAVAQAIVRAIRRDRPRVLVGPDTKGIDALVRALPGRHSLLGPVISRLMDSAVGASPKR